MHDIGQCTTHNSRTSYAKLSRVFTKKTSLSAFTLDDIRRRRRTMTSRDDEQQ